MLFNSVFIFAGIVFAVCAIYFIKDASTNKGYNSIQRVGVSAAGWILLFAVFIICVRLLERCEILDKSVMSWLK
jgi:hypothetical protein